MTTRRKWLKNNKVFSRRNTSFASFWLWFFLSPVPALSEESEPGYELPDLAHLIQVASEFGSIESVTGQRHYSGAPIIGWDDSYFPKTSKSPVYHVHGFGGAGLTLAPAAAKNVSLEALTFLQEHPAEEINILVFGAGYIGVFAALEIRKQLNSHGMSHIPVKVVAKAFPKGISTLLPDFHEPTLEDNYSSQIAGGWIMPVSVKPVEPKTQWCKMVTESQNFWEGLTKDPVFRQAVLKTQSLVFYDSRLGESTVNIDKSGIRKVNAQCKPELYPEHTHKGTFYSRDLNAPSGEHRLTPIKFDRVSVFDNVIEADTCSVLKQFTEELLALNVEFIQTEAQLKDIDELLAHAKTPRTLIINASGHGASSIFGGVQATPIRGDLVILRIPTTQLTPNWKQTSKYSYWAGGSYYVFIRFSLDGEWMEAVLGGTFLQKQNDLSLSAETSKDIGNFWLKVFHFGSTNLTEQQTEIINAVQNSTWINP